MLRPLESDDDPPRLEARGEQGFLRVAVDLHSDFATDGQAALYSSGSKTVWQLAVTTYRSTLQQEKLEQSRWLDVHDNWDREQQGEEPPPLSVSEARDRGSVRVRRAAASFSTACCTTWESVSC